MKKIFTIKVQSVSDIITNSSSEIYKIKSNIDSDLFRELWDTILKNWGYTEEEIKSDYTIKGSIYRENENIFLDYGVMCNVDEEIFDKLREIFGDENVKDVTWDW